MDELDDRPKRVRARARTPLAEDGVCGFEHAEVDVHVAVAERLDELLVECECIDEVSWVRSLTYIDEIGPSFRKIQLCYQGDGLCDLRTDGLVSRTGKGDHRRDKLRFERILVRNGDGVLVLYVGGVEVSQKSIDKTKRTSSNHPSLTMFLRYTLAARRTAPFCVASRTSRRRWTTKAGCRL